MSHNDDGLSDQEKRKLASELMMPSGPVAAFLAAALLVAACLWEVHGVMKPVSSASASATALQYRQWVSSSLEGRLPEQPILEP